MGAWRAKTTGLAKADTSAMQVGRKAAEEAAKEPVLYCPWGTFNQMRCPRLLEDQAAAL